MDILKEINRLEENISYLSAKLVQAKHEYLTEKGWIIEDVAGDDFLPMFTYTKGGYTTICEDHAMEHEPEEIKSPTRQRD